MRKINHDEIKIYHIIHVDRLCDIFNDGFLFSDRIMSSRTNAKGTNIGIQRIKERRLQLKLSSYSDLFVGDCVPFYFCPRSVMLYVICCKNNQDLTYKGGQENILHLEFNLNNVLNWARANNKRCVFTTSNAGSYYFNDYNDFSQLDIINWDAINATNWQAVKEEKQAELLVENSLDLRLLDRIGVNNSTIYTKVSTILNKHAQIYHPKIEVVRDWYY